MARFELDKAELLTLGLAGAEAALAAWIWAQGVGPIVPLHFGFEGRPDRWGSPRELAWVVAGLALGGVLVVSALGWAARRAEAPEQRRRGLHLAQALTATVLSILALILGGMALELGGARLVGVGLALVCVAIGAFLGRVPPNALVGLRTPWSLSSRLAWDRSNRLAGRLCLALGILGVMGASAVEPSLAMQLLGGGMLAGAAVAVFESWRVWRTDPERRLV